MGEDFLDVAGDDEAAGELAPGNLEQVSSLASSAQAAVARAAAAR